MQLYKEYPLVLNEILCIEKQEEFEDFLKENHEIDEGIFWLFYSASIGQSILIGIYEGEVYEKVMSYFQTRLPVEILEQIKEVTNSIYINIDENRTIEPFIKEYNKILRDTNYYCKQQFDNTYYDGVYFLEVALKEEK